MENTTADKLYSHHIFIFPFKWKREKDDSEKEDAFVQLGRLFARDNHKLPWEQKRLELKTPYQYNELNYFYDYVRETLYDSTDIKQPGAPDKPTPKTILQFVYPLKSKATYCIETEHTTDELEVDRILLNIYATGVGMLSFHLSNRKEAQSSPEAILRINQFGRRLFTPFFNIDPTLISDYSRVLNYGKFELSYKELAKSITLRLPNQSELKENFSSYTPSTSISKSPFRLPNFIRCILPEELGDANDTGKMFCISPVLDDRMFTICWYGNNAIAGRLYRQPSASFWGLRDKWSSPLLYLSDEWWYQYVFVDTYGMTCQHAKMQETLVQAATNARWAGYGTYYGVTDYSFVVLTQDLETLKKNNASFLVNHLRSVYYKLSELVLVQRASVQYFSEQVTHISGLEGADVDTQLAEGVSNLYKEYIRFVNRIYFREVTAQAQGIELYKQLQEQCGLEKQVKDLDGEINELHSYVMLREEKKRNVQLENLTKLGSATLFPSLIMGYYGINFWPNVDNCNQLPLLITAVLSAFLAGFFAFHFFAKKSAKYLKWVWLGALIITLLSSAFVPYFLLQHCPDTTAEQAEKKHNADSTRVQQLYLQLERINATVDSLYHQSKTIQTSPAHAHQ